MKNKVAVYCAFKEDNNIFFLLLKRSEERGGFWQPVTGGEEPSDNNDLIKTVIREVKEELGITISRKQVLDISYTFNFKDKRGREKKEYCFGLVLSSKQKKSIRLSEEHTALIWSRDYEEVIDLLKYEENKVGFKKFVDRLVSI